MLRYNFFSYFVKSLVGCTLHLKIEFLDRRKLKGTYRWYLRPPKLDTAADGVIGTAMKSCIHWHPAHLIRGPWSHQNYFKPNRWYLVLAASGASDQDLWGAYGFNFSWRFQLHHRRPCPTSAAKISLICPLQLSPILGSSPPPWRPCSCHRQ